MDYREKRDRAWAEATQDKLSLGVNELMAIKTPEPRDGDKWGNWTFRQNNLTLQYGGSEGDDYEIDLEKIEGSLDVIILQKHLSEKVFVTAEDIGNLFFAIQDLSGVWWQPDTDIAELVRRRYGKHRTAA